MGNEQERSMWDSRALEIASSIDKFVEAIHERDQRIYDLINDNFFLTRKNKSLKDKIYQLKIQNDLPNCHYSMGERLFFAPHVVKDSENK